MAEDDPRRMDEIRKYSAIYGRFDCKRKPEKPLTLHEVSVNEAAAQLCSKLPALLGKREELFPLARQVVRESGYKYSKGHSRSQNTKLFDELTSGSGGGSDQQHQPGGGSSKRMRLETSPGGSTAKDQKGMANIDEGERKRRYVSVMILFCSVSMLFVCFACSTRTASRALSISSSRWATRRKRYRHASMRRRPRRTSKLPPSCRMS